MVEHLNRVLGHSGSTPICGSDVLDVLEALKVSIRNDEGEWVVGFHRNLGDLSITVVELLAARECLTLTCDIRVPKIDLEFDSEVIVKMIREANVDTHPLGWIIEDCRRLLGMPWESKIIHIRSGNRCADLLARMVHEVNEPYQIWENPPPDLLPLLGEDLD